MGIIRIVCWHFWENDQQAGLPDSEMKCLRGRFDSLDSVNGIQKIRPAACAKVFASSFFWQWQRPNDRSRLTIRHVQMRRVEVPTKRQYTFGLFHNATRRKPVSNYFRSRQHRQIEPHHKYSLQPILQPTDSLRRRSLSKDVSLREQSMRICYVCRNYYCI